MILIDFQFDNVIED